MLLCLIQTWSRGGYPIQTWLGVPWVPPPSSRSGRWVLYPDLVRGVPPEIGYPPDLGWGTPQNLGWGIPPRPWMGYPLPRHGMGYPPDLRWGTPHPHLDLGWGNPLPRPDMGSPFPRKCGQTENITSRHPSNTGGNYDLTY